RLHDQCAGGWGYHQHRWQSTPDSVWLEVYNVADYPQLTSTELMDTARDAVKRGGRADCCYPADSLTTLLGRLLDKIGDRHTLLEGVAAYSEIRLACPLAHG